MKILIVSVIMLIATSMASAQISVNASIQADVDNIVASAQKQAQATVSAAYTAIQSASSAYYQANVKARDLIVATLNRLGSKGQEVATRFNSDINNATDSVASQFDNQIAQIQQFLSNNSQAVLSQVQSDAEKLEAAVQSNNASINCWLENRETARELVRSAGEQSLSIVAAGASTLALQNLRLVIAIGKAVLRIEADVFFKCGLSKTCAGLYVS